MNALGGKHPILYMEEKPRGEKSFWWVSTDWLGSEGNQEVSAAQHRDRKASGTISTYFGGGAGGAIYYTEQELGGLSVTLMCKQSRGIHCRAPSTLMINHSAFSGCLPSLTSDCKLHNWLIRLIVVWHDNTTDRSVSVLHQGNREVIISHHLQKMVFQS